MSHPSMHHLLNDPFPSATVSLEVRNQEWAATISMLSSHAQDQSAAARQLVPWSHGKQASIRPLTTKDGSAVVDSAVTVTAAVGKAALLNVQEHLLKEHTCSDSNVVPAHSCAASSSCAHYTDHMTFDCPPACMLDTSLPVPVVPVMSSATVKAGPRAPTPALTLLQTDRYCLPIAAAPAWM